MNLGERVSCGKLTPTHIGLVDRKVQSIIATAVEADTLELGGTDLQTTLTSLAAGAQTADWNHVSNKPGDNAFLDWTQDQGDTNIDANNLPLLNYAPNTLASNGTAGLTNYNFNQARKDKLAGIADNAQVNVQADWNASSGSAQILNKPDLSIYLTAVPTAVTDSIAVNTAKIGITQSQADAIVANTAKIGITQSQSDAIVANSAKVGITTAQADAIVANTAKPTTATVQGLLSPYALTSNVVAKSGSTMTGALQLTNNFGGATTFNTDGSATFGAGVTIDGDNVHEDRTDQTLDTSVYSIHPTTDNSKSILLGDSTSTSKKYWKKGGLYTRSQTELIAYNSSASSANVVQMNSTGTASTSVNNYVAPGGNHMYEDDAGKYGLVSLHQLNFSPNTSNYAAATAGIHSVTDGTGGKLSFRTSLNGTLRERLTLDAAGLLDCEQLHADRLHLTNSSGQVTAFNYNGHTINYIAGTTHMNNGVDTFKWSHPTLASHTTINFAGILIQFGSSFILDNSNGTRTALNYAGTSTNYIRGTTYITYYAGSSDDRMKFEETPVTDGLAVIRQLRPQTYKKTKQIEELTDDNYIVETGFIAQEVETIPQLAHCVSAAPDDGTLHLHYNGIFSYCVAAVQELDAKVNSQATRILALESRLANL